MVEHGNFKTSPGSLHHRTASSPADIKGLFGRNKSSTSTSTSTRTRVRDIALQKHYQRTRYRSD